ncbi:hypothetical protein BDQ17DRAFT_1330690 [Cyathus striatus]|nr:hypothetical protein BDQ17DRAFT_1330690 [Cyathus striatus]
MNPITTPTDLQTGEISNHPQSWQMKVWMDDWKDAWISYGPNNFLHDEEIGISRENYKYKEKYSESNWKRYPTLEDQKLTIITVPWLSKWWVMVWNVATPQAPLLMY